MLEPIEAAAELAGEIAAAAESEAAEVSEGVVEVAQELESEGVAAEAAGECEAEAEVFEAADERQGGLAACNWRCIQSSCYPPNLAKGIGVKHPAAPNSSIGHT